uniref:Uncharacterized protein n=1 Tax=Globodera pallida TaxID=36090 RepID=A0A183BQA9_GLOPA
MNECDGSSPTSDQLVPQLPTGPELSVEPNPTVPAPSTGPGLNELGKRILAPPQVQFQIRNLGPNPEGIPGFGASAYAHTPKPSSPAAVQPSAASSSSAQSLPTKTDGSNLMGSVSGVPATAPPAAAPLVPAASSGPCPAVVPAAAGAVPAAEPAVPAAVAESAYGGGAEPAAPAPVPSAAVQNAVGGTPVPSVAEGPSTAAIGQSSQSQTAPVPESPQPQQQQQQQQQSVIAPLQMPSAATGGGTENAEQINVPPTSGPAVAPAFMDRVHLHLCPFWFLNQPPLLQLFQLHPMDPYKSLNRLQLQLQALGQNQNLLPMKPYNRQFMFMLVRALTTRKKQMLAHRRNSHRLKRSRQFLLRKVKTKHHQQLHHQLHKFSPYLNPK